MNTVVCDEEVRFTAVTLGLDAPPSWGWAEVECICVVHLQEGKAEKQEQRVQPSMTGAVWTLCIRKTQEVEHKKEREKRGTESCNLAARTLMCRF